jgi:hypothetical protein
MTNSITSAPRKLAEFLASSTRNEQQVVERHPEIYALIDRLHHSFEKMIGGTYGGPALPSLLVLTAYSYFLAGVRIALAGQMPPIFPVLRAGIESVLFGLLMTENPSKEEIWINRDKSDVDEKKCRNTFTATNGLKILLEIDAELHDCVKHQYDLAINSGAHPNVGAVIPHVNVEDAGTHWLTQVRVIHPSDSMAVLDSITYTVAVGASMLGMMAYAMKGHVRSSLAFEEAHAVFVELERIAEVNKTAVD